VKSRHFSGLSPVSGSKVYRKLRPCARVDPTNNCNHDTIWHRQIYNIFSSRNAIESKMDGVYRTGQQTKQHFVDAACSALEKIILSRIRGGCT